ncbi:MAG: zinc ribbon domain-containing protein [Gemmatimonadales bacterium]
MNQSAAANRAACPKCGATASGRFCSECGTAVTPGSCRQCGKPVPSASKFCPECGAPAGGGPHRGRGDLIPWIVGAGLLVVILVLVARQDRAAAPEAPAAPFAGAAGGGAPPDISNLSPRERFDRLYNRVMQASESGDTAQVAQFTPMALMAYGDLGQVDADARYHAAMLRLHTGDPAGAQFLADSILAEHPSHLFGLMVEGAIARWNQDDAGRTRVERAYLAAYEKEIASGLPEYREHQTALENFRSQASARAK